MMGLVCLVVLIGMVIMFEGKVVVFSLFSVGCVFMLFELNIRIFVCCLF